MKRMWAPEEINKQVSEASKENELNIDLSSIVDSEGRKRFQDFDITPAEIPGFTFTYGKASLSGTHLMLVLAGEIENETEVTYDTILGLVELPSWITDKITPIYSTVVINWITANIYDSTGQSQSALFRLLKESNQLAFKMYTITLTAKRSFRIEFDLLIDSE